MSRGECALQSLLPSLHLVLEASITLLVRDCGALVDDGVCDEEGKSQSELQQSTPQNLAATHPSPWNSSGCNNLVDAFAILYRCSSRSP